MNTVFRTLPNKEAQKFKIVVKSYDEKKFKQGKKILNQLIKKFKSRSVYLTMKALLDFHLTNDKKERK